MSDGLNSKATGLVEELGEELGAEAVVVARRPRGPGTGAPASTRTPGT